eukprot:scaffold75412_cov96-Phaeocystis_antarctica.AAC.1
MKVLQHGHVLLEERRFETRLGAPQSSRLPITHQRNWRSTALAEVPSFNHSPIVQLPPGCASTLPSSEP